MIGLGFLDEDFEALDILFMMRDGKANARAFLLGEFRFLVRGFDALEAGLNFSKFILHGFDVLQGEAVDRTDLVFDVFGIARFA